MNNKYLEKIASKRIHTLINKLKAEDILETASDVKSVYEASDKAHKEYLSQTYNIKDKSKKSKTK